MTNRLGIKATCPNNPQHNRFKTVAVVLEDWLVDEHGNWIESLDTIQTIESPRVEMGWQCAICGADATAEKTEG